MNHDSLCPDSLSPVVFNDLYLPPPPPQVTFCFNVKKHLFSIVSNNKRIMHGSVINYHLSEGSLDQHGILIYLENLLLYIYIHIYIYRYISIAVYYITIFDDWSNDRFMHFSLAFRGIKKEVFC